MRSGKFCWPAHSSSSRSSLGCTGHPASADQSQRRQDQPYAPPPSSASPQMTASVRKAAAHFSSVYLSRAIFGLVGSARSPGQEAYPAENLGQGS